MRYVAVIALLMAAVACKKSEKGGSVKRVTEAADASAAPAPPGELGPVRDAETSVTLVIYYLPRPTAPPRPVFDAVLATMPELKVVDELAPGGPRPAVFYDETDPMPLSADQLPYMSRGLDDAQRAAVLESKVAVVLGFAGRAEHAAADLRRAHAIAGQVAARTGGLLWSDEARMLYGKEAWQHRVDAAAAEPPETPGLYTVHMYEVDGGGIRLVSLGLGQLALPELAIDDAPSSRAREANVLLNAVAQLLVEGRAPAADGRFEVDLAALRNAETAKELQPPENKFAPVEVKLVAAVPQEGDNEGRLWRIDFPGDGSYSERLVATTTKLFGITDEIINAGDDDAELMAARDRARKRLPEVMARFSKGLPPGDHLLVKGPLGSPGSREWVWVEVRRWDRGRIRGVLMSQPSQDLGVQEGSEVEVAEADVFDWSIHHEDGSMEGGETNEILVRRQR